MKVDKDETLEKGIKRSVPPAIQLFGCGLVSGIMQAALFNPWDRALYLSVKHSRSFLHISNFKRPFEGLLQTITQRAISAGFYFPLEQLFMDRLQTDFGGKSALRPYISFLAGTFAGMTNGLLMNPFTTIKV